jgi:hypothetical protein
MEVFIILVKLSLKLLFLYYHISLGDVLEYYILFDDPVLSLVLGQSNMLL